MKVTKSEFISTTNPNKISFALSLHASTSKSLFEPDALQNLRVRNPDRLLISHLNINSLRNKFKVLELTVKDFITPETTRIFV